MCLDEVEAALEGGFHLTDSCVNGIVNRLEELSNLVDAEQHICVEYEGNDNLSRRECSSFKRRVTSVCESIATFRTPQPGTFVPGVDGGFTAIRTKGPFPSVLTAPLDFVIEQLWPQHY